jgi:8-oxo-dGTP pyrophosphatase MutT (NUDIX family)
VSLHADALAALSSWAAPSSAQEALRVRYVDHLRARPDGLDRACFPDHVTAGVLVIDGTGEQVLLNLHRKAQRWFAFGGHCEPGDDTLAGAALREGLEESGLPTLRFDPEPAHLDEHAVPFCDPRGTVQHLDVRYVAQAPEGARHASSAESLDVRWWPLDGLPDLEPEMHELIAIAVRRFA